VTRYTPLWQQNSTYPAAIDRNLLQTLWPASGSTGGAATTVNNTMNVSVAAGTAAVAIPNVTPPGTQLCRWDAAEVVTLAAAPVSGSSRIDLVVLQVRDAFIDAGSNNDFIFQAITGTVATPGPGAVPAVPTNAYPICQVLVAGGVANLNGATVTDRRAPLPSAIHARVTRTAVFSPIPTGALTNVPWDTIDRDSYGLYSIANQRFTCPLAGWYLVSGAVYGVMPAAGNSLQTAVLQNGTVKFRTLNGSPSAGGAAVPVFANTLYCAAGDTLTVQWVTSGSNVSTTYPDPSNNYASFDFLGTG